MSDPARVVAPEQAPSQKPGAASAPQRRLSTGIAGLDEVMRGGLLAGRSYMLRGGPGTGKTTFGLQFLLAGAVGGEKALFIALDEQAGQIRRDAAGQGLALEGISFLDLSPTSEYFAAADTYDIFSAADVEREPTTRRIVAEIEAVQPQRVFIDALTQFRFFTKDAFQFRKQVLSFLRFLLEKGATVLFASEGSDEMPDDDLQFLADGVLRLERTARGRSIEVSKFRGSAFQSGVHSVRLGATGATVFPRLLPQEHHRDYLAETVSSGVPELDELLHGGLERGTVTIISGPSGVGKTTLGALFMKEAAGRGERSVLYTFEESVETLLQRCEAINIPIHAMMSRGTMKVVKVEPLEYTPDEFSRMVRDEVEKSRAAIVMIDSVSGYRISLAGDDQNLVANIHSLGKYLSNMGVTALLIAEIESITGEFRATDVGVSYLADNIIFLRYLEIAGELHKAIGVLKKRLSDFEKALRRIEITKYGVRVGRPLTDLRNILGGAQVSVAEKS